MIQVNQLSKQFGDRVLFEDVSFNVNPKERIGLVGRNGTGKSTLFKILTGQLTPDHGEVVIPKGYYIGALEQHLNFTHPTILEECASALSEDQKYEVYRAEKILSGLGFDESDFDRPASDFSGGYQIRINLAKLLLTGPQMLLLDEPTNYLDIVSMRWLAGVLKSFNGEVIIITHDRDFMDSVCTHIMGIHRGGLKKQEGDTEKFYQQIFQEEEIYEQTRQNLEKKKRHMEVFVERFRAKASKATQAQSKLKQLEKMDDLEELDDISQMSLRFNYADCPGKFPLKVEDLSFSYDDGPTLFSNVSFALKKGERIGVIGKNGKGKSTLLNVIAGEFKPKTGEVTFHPSAKIAHFGQTNVLRLHLKNTIEQEVAEANPELSYSRIRAICGAMLFSGDDAKKQISVLSGGERARVLLGKIIARPSNILLLDEPTNHLDMESIEILIDELEAFPGAVMIVTHSERLLKRVAKNLIVFSGDENGGAEFFHGGYQDFLEKVGWGDESTRQKKKNKGTVEKISRKEAKKRRTEMIAQRSKELTPLKESIAALEKKVIELEEQKDKLNQQLIKASANQGGSAAEISKELAEIESELEIFDQEFEQKSEELIEKEDFFEQELQKIEEMSK